MLSTWQLAARQERLSMVKETKQHLQVQKYFCIWFMSMLNYFKVLRFWGSGSFLLPAAIVWDCKVICCGFDLWL